MANMKFPVGIETFEDIISSGYVYIDKTELIHRLITNGKYYFLSRPRRFGKSLLLSTIRAYFEGKKELFKGLAIEKYEKDWAVHPVFHLNLIGFTGDSVDGLTSMLERQFTRWEDIYGKNSSEHYFADRFAGLIERAYERTGHRAVILIDEYDKPLISSLDDKVSHDRFRNILKPIYSNLKSQDRFIRFAMITGVSRFSRMSIFSDINNLRDISLSDDYSAICGITEREMLDGCHDAIQMMADANGWSYTDTLAQLKNNYDGYHFAEKSEDIYNPFSLFSALADKTIRSYWAFTGTPTFLAAIMRRGDFRLDRLNGEKIRDMEISDSESHMDNPIPVLYQTGYLTIDRYIPERKLYVLKVPNREVEEALFSTFFKVYSRKDSSADISEIDRLIDDIEEGEAEALMERLQSFMADIPYDLSRNKPEVYFENNLFIIFKLIGYYVNTEYRTSSGRIDLLLKTNRYIYIMELKLNGSAEDAMEQIDSKGYALPFERDGRTIIKIGISFSKDTRNIDGWVIR